MPRAKKSAAPKSTKTETKKVNKTAWIRSQAASLSAKEVVEKAAKEAIKISLAQVYTARSTAKKTVGAEPKKPGRPPNAAGASKPSGSSNIEKVIEDLIWQHGWMTVETIVNKIKSRR